MKHGYIELGFITDNLLGSRKKKVVLNKVTIKTYEFPSKLELLIIHFYLAVYTR